MFPRVKRVFSKMLFLVSPETDNGCQLELSADLLGGSLAFYPQCHGCSFKRKKTVEQKRVRNRPRMF